MKLTSLLLLITAFAGTPSSARLTRRSATRRNVVSLQDGEAIPAPTQPAAVRRRSAALPSTGFCRKWAPQSTVPVILQPSSSGDAASTTTTSYVASSSTEQIESVTIPVASCQPGLDTSECLPTITIQPQLTTSYIDVTTTILVTSEQALDISLPTSSASLSSSEVSSPSTPGSTPTSAAPTVISSTPTTSTPIATSQSSSLASISASIVTSASISASLDPTVPSSTPNRCPPGSSWRRVTDDFATFDSSKWKKEAGKDEQLSFGKDGLLMKLTEEDANIIFESNAKWIAPVTLTASIKTARAGGIVNCAIFGQAGTDEIDLELIEGSYQVPMWHNGKRLEKNKDVTWTLADTSHEMSSWVFNDRNVVPFANVNDWTMHWDKDYLTWSADGKKLLDVRKMDGGAWPDQAMPFRWGPWAAAGGWAGNLNWTARPEPVMQFKRVSIEGCQLGQGDGARR